MYSKTLFTGLLLCFGVISAGFLTQKPATVVTEAQLTIQLRWTKTIPNEEWKHMRKGLIWGMSHLGAQLQAGSFDSAVQMVEPNVFSLNLMALGFPVSAHQPLAGILDSLKKTDEYQRFRGIDLGRFMVLTVHSPAHYYRITGAEENLKTFQRKYKFKKNERSFAVVHSSVAIGNRLIHYVPSKNPLEMAFLAEEGTGDLERGNFKRKETEVIAVMPNGQFRFAIYNEDGHLISATSAALGIAGKPGNCMWCHESATNILREFTPEVEGYVTKETFVNDMSLLQADIEAWRNQFKLDLDYRELNDHSTHELYYISFMEPSAQRLAKEWEMPISQVQALLAGLPTHINQEFKFLGELYHRAAVDARSPFPVTVVPSSVREYAEYEPDFLGDLLGRD
jgi:hypothetical protein